MKGEEKPMKLLTAAALIALTAAPAVAAPLCTEFGFAGLLAKCNRAALPTVTLASGKPLADAPWDLQSGAYYEVEITSDGSQELALAGPEFFRAVWIDEVVIDGLEVRPLALDSVEFDDEGTMRITFVAIKPGRYQLRIPGSTGETQKIDISIE
jgi:hypothetical protein